METINKLDLNDLNIYLRIYGFLSIQFSCPWSRLSVLHFLEDTCYLTSFQDSKNQKSIVSVMKMGVPEVQYDMNWQINGLDNLLTLGLAYILPLSLNFNMFSLLFLLGGFFLLGKVYLKCKGSVLWVFEQKKNKKKGDRNGKQEIWLRTGTFWCWLRRRHPVPGALLLSIGEAVLGGEDTRISRVF